MFAWVVGGWVMYSLLMYVCLRVRHEWAFWSIWIVFCAILIINFGGCDEVLKDTTRPIP